MVGPVHVGQLVCWEAAAAAVVAGLGRTTSVLVTVSVVAGVALTLSGIRYRQRWFYQWLGLWVRYLARARRRSLPAELDGTGRAAVLLDQLSPGARTGSLQVDGVDCGIVEHQGGVTALVELGPAGPGLLVEGPQSVPSPATLLPLSEPGDPVVTIQVVVRTTRAAPSDPAAGVASSSYRQLTGGSVPAHRSTWIALQVLRTADDHADADLRAAVQSAVRRLLRRLTKDGAQVRLLDHVEALTVLGALAHVELPMDGRRREPSVLRERWQSWTSGGLTQTTLRLRTWPEPGGRDGHDLVDRLGAVPASTTTVALAARRRRAEVELQALVRLAAPDTGSLRAATSSAKQTAASSGAALDTLYGEQVHGLAGSLPLGGFLP